MDITAEDTGEDTIHAALALELLGAIVDWVSSP